MDDLIKVMDMPVVSIERNKEKFIKQIPIIKNKFIGGGEKFSESADAVITITKTLVRQ